MSDPVRTAALGPRPLPSGPRLDWAQAPEHVRAAVEGLLGSAVVAASSQVGGFSPGPAARVVLRDGRRVFVKACGPELNPDSPGLLRQEAAALRALPTEVPAARLLASHDDGDWIALVLEDVAGRQPDLHLPDDLSAVSAAVEAASAVLAPAGLPDVRAAAIPIGAWDDVAANPAGIEAAVLARLDAMVAQQDRARRAVAGDRLVHADVRSDNVLIRRDGSAFAGGLGLGQPRSRLARHTPHRTRPESR